MAFPPHFAIHRMDDTIQYNATHPHMLSPYSVPAKITMDSTISAHLTIILNMYIRFPLYSSL